MHLIQIFGARITTNSPSKWLLLRTPMPQMTFCHLLVAYTFHLPIHQFPNAPITKKRKYPSFVKYQFKSNTVVARSLVCIKLRWTKRKKRPRDDKENRSTSFSRGMYFLNANMNKTFGEKNRRNALSSWRKNLSKQPTHLKWSALRPHQATFNWIKFSHDLGELLIFSDLKA